MSLGLALERPPVWKHQENDAGLIFAGPADEQDPDAFRPTVNVVVADLEGVEAIDLDALAEAQLDEMSRVLTDVLVIDVAEDEVATLPARKTVLTFRQGIYAITLEQWIAVRGSTIVTVSAASENHEYARQASVAERLVRSLELLD
jgi:hypothetical protein